MSESYLSLNQKPYKSLYMYLETVINHPPEAVWPHAVDIGAWMNAHKLVTVDGAKGQVGFFERAYAQALTEGTPEPHYHLYGIAYLVPHKFIALEVFPEQGGSYGNATPRLSFDSILLVDLGGSTKVIFSMVDAILGEPEPSFEARQAEEHDAGIRQMEGYFERLRQLVHDGMTAA